MRENNKQLDDLLKVSQEISDKLSDVILLLYKNPVDISNSIENMIGYKKALPVFYMDFAVDNMNKKYEKIHQKEYEVEQQKVQDEMDKTSSSSEE